jgi:glycosyltransferase involved in cell wall biosynthesis
MDNPQVSIITVVRNGEKTLEQTMLSVFHQTYSNIEYIIIDGASTDGTVDIIKKYDKRIMNGDFPNVSFKWISEPDKGIYDAMNKGIDMATGEYIFFLGANDEIYKPNSIAEIISKSNEAYIIISKILYSNSIIVTSKYSFKTILHNTIHHQSALYNKRLFDNFRYDIRFDLISDYELNLTIYLKKMKYCFVDIVLSQCSDNGVSRRYINQAFKETNIIRRKLMGNISYVFQMGYILKHTIHQIFKNV